MGDLANLERQKLIEKVLKNQGINYQELLQYNLDELKEINKKHDENVLINPTKKTNNQALAQIEFSLFANSVEEIFWLRDVSGKNILYVNRAYETIFGKSCESLYLNPYSFMESVIPEDRHLLVEAHKKLTVDKSIEINYRIKKANNEIVWIKSKTKPYYNYDNEIIGYAGVAVDISDYKKYENQVNKAHQYFEQAGAIANLGFYELDLINNTLEWSKVTKEIHEVELDYEPVLSESINFYDPEFSRELITNAVNEATTNGKEFDLNLRIITAKGNKKWVRAIGRTEFKEGKCVRLYGAFQDIDSYKLLEENLEKERDGLKNVLEGTLAGTWEWNIQTGETIYNERWANIIGYTLEELAPLNIHTWIKYLHPDDKLTSENTINKYFLGETEYYESEFRMKHKNGDWVWILDRGKIYKWDENGKPLMMAGTHQDINNRKNAEFENKKLSKAIEQSPASIVITNLKGEIEYVNPYFTKITGYSLEEAIGKNPRILKSGDKTDVDYQNLWDNITTGNQWSGEFKNLKKNGEEYWEFASISPISDETGKITNFIAVKEEISFRKKAEERLKASEEKYRSLFELSPYGMAAINKQTGEVEIINKRFEEITEYTLSEFVTVKKFMELVFPDDSYRQELIEKRAYIFSEYLHKGIHPPPVEMKITTKSGITRIIELTYVLVGDYVVSIYNDITEKKEYTDALEKQNKILGEISWIQSHVVRAPLARLMGLFDLLKTRDFKMVNEDELYRLIEQSMEELDKHIKDISQKAYLVNYLSSNRKYGSTGSPAS